MFELVFGGCWLAALSAAWLVPDAGRRFCSLALPVAGLATISAATGSMVPWQRLVCTSLGLLYLLKASLLLRLFLRSQVRRAPPTGLLLYFTIWPGMAPNGVLLDAKRRSQSQSRRIVRGSIGIGFGIALMGIIVLLDHVMSDEVVGWLGLAALLMFVQFGWAEILTAWLNRLGWKVEPLFDVPLRSRSLAEFWSQRWNLAVVEMDRLLFLPMLRGWLGRSRAAVFGIFFVSGVLHEGVISYPVQAGYGQPLLYFGLQGLGFSLERRWLRNASDWQRSLWTWSWILLPIGLLFHHAFRQTLIVPLFTALSHRVLEGSFHVN